MKLTTEQKEVVLNALKEKYNEGISITDSSDVEIDGELFETFAAINERVRILFVLFDGHDHRDKTSIIQRLVKSKKYTLGHGVHYQFENNELLGIILSNEIE